MTAEATDTGVVDVTSWQPQQRPIQPLVTGGNELNLLANRSATASWSLEVGQLSLRLGAHIATTTNGSSSIQQQA